MATLLALRIYGPCRMAELAGRVDEAGSILDEVNMLLERGMAEQLEDGSLDVTRKGRAMIGAALAMRRQAAALLARRTLRWPHEHGRPSL